MPQYAIYADQYILGGPWHGRKYNYEYGPGDSFIVAEVKDPASWFSLQPEYLVIDQTFTQYRKAAYPFNGVMFYYWLPSDGDPKKAFIELAKLIMEKEYEKAQMEP